MTDHPQEQLQVLIRNEISAEVPPDARALCDELSKKNGVLAVVFYGSGLWKEASADTVYDFYLIVDRYRDFSPNPLLAMGGSIVPPNVYYHEHNAKDGRKLRCKYAVLRMDQFISAAGGQSFTPHIWARFCQPARIPYVRDKDIEARLLGALTDATITFHKHTLQKQTADELSVKDLWQTGLQFTYQSELRSEKKNRTFEIFDHQTEAFVRRTQLACRILSPEHDIIQGDRVLTPYPSLQRKRQRMLYQFKKPFMKAVILCRFFKAAFTFRAGLEYAQWKIHRQSGVFIEINDFQRKHPILGSPPLLWKVFREGGLK